MSKTPNNLAFCSKTGFGIKYSLASSVLVLLLKCFCSLQKCPAKIRNPILSKKCVCGLLNCYWQWFCSGISKLCSLLLFLKHLKET